MKLRLGLTNQDLAVRFEIPKCLINLGCYAGGYL